MGYVYESLPEGVRQYDDIDLSRHKIVKAKYVDTVAFRGNPYIEALPFAKTKEEVATSFNVIPDIPDPKELQKLPIQMLDMVVERLKDYRIALPFHAELESEFVRVLIDSYASRVESPTQSELLVAGQPYGVSTILTAFHRGEAVIGLSLLGTAGSGKTTAMNLVMDEIPQVILHDYDGCNRVQLVYLYVTCETNSNFHALYQAIGRAIDDALQNGNHEYEKEIISLRTLGVKALKVREWVEKLAIGIIIFDEIQNIDLQSVKENSIAALLTINNETHVGMGVLGTEDAFRGLFARDWTARRFSAYIPASQYCDNKKTLRRIIEGIFLTQVFDPPITQLDDEIVDIFIKASDGIIAYIVLLYYYVSKDYIHRKDKIAVNGLYIKEIAEKKAKIILDMIARHQQSRHQNEVERRKLIKEMNNFGDSVDRKEAYMQFEEIASTYGDIISKIARAYPNYNSITIYNAVFDAFSAGMKTDEEIITEAEKTLDQKAKKKSIGEYGTKKSLGSMLEDLHKLEIHSEP